MVTSKTVNLTVHFVCSNNRVEQSWSLRVVKSSKGVIKLMHTVVRKFSIIIVGELCLSLNVVELGSVGTLLSLNIVIVRCMMSLLVVMVGHSVVVQLLPQVVVTVVSNVRQLHAVALAEIKGVV